MNLRSSGDVDLVLCCLSLRLVEAALEPVLEHVGHGDQLDRAVLGRTGRSPAAPVPRPPQPTRAMLMVLLSPAYKPDRPKPAATARPPVAFRASRRAGGDRWFAAHGILSEGTGLESEDDGPAGGGRVGRRGISGGIVGGGRGTGKGESPRTAVRGLSRATYFFQLLHLDLAERHDRAGVVVLQGEVALLVPVLRVLPVDRRLAVHLDGDVVARPPITSCVNHSSGLCGAVSRTVILSR